MGGRRKRLTPQSFYKILHRIADRKVGAAEEAFLRATSVTLSEIDPGRLDRALSAVYQSLRRQVDAGGKLSLPPELLTEVFDSVGINGQLAASVKERYASLLRTVVIESGTATATLMPPRFSLVFDITNPRATSFAARSSSRFAKSLEVSARKAVRREIARGFRLQRTVKDTAKALRQVVGLGEQHAAWLANFRDNWLDDMASRAAEGRPLLAKHRKRLRQLQSRFPTAEQPFTAAERRALVTKYRERLIKLHAENVARTETIRAAGGGQVEAWKQAAEKGLIDTKVFRKGWSYTKDSLTTCSCKSIPRLNPAGVPLDKPFRMEDCRTGKFRWVYLPGDTHRLCRCALVAIFKQRDADVEVPAA